MRISTMPPVLAAACAFGLLAGLQATDADAANQRSRHYRPAGICEAPLPVYDAYLRKSPLMVANVGNQTVFVNCAMASDPAGDVGRAWIEIHMASSATANTSVTCTLVTGSADAPLYHTSTRSMAPGANTWATWSTLDKGSADGLFAFMCSLPPDVRITHAYAKEEDSAGGI